MATYGKKLLDSNNNVILPKTRSSLVYMDDNSTVEDTIGSVNNDINNIKTMVPYYQVNDGISYKDLNEIVEPGVYTLSFWGDGLTYNAPDNYCIGMLWVGRKWGADTRINQLIYKDQFSFYYRSYLSGAWTSWQRLNTIEFGANPSNWNNINITSIYCIAHSSLSVTGSPKGAYGYGTLLHFEVDMDYTKYSCQMYVPHRDTMYFRSRLTASEWAEWRKAQCTEVDTN